MPMDDPNVPNRKTAAINAFMALAEALADYALHEDFERGSKYHRQVVGLAMRWQEGKPASPRTKTEG